ncbi:hypothetical protein PHMEG_0005195 [Phytophthora megakarya]|uniref:Protein C10 n=1 Tax=Phytophthora megakarya TaxID=4795 RepID=A0A225WRX9_9STRA|nr:hypothetical protein PHMEG_0005195 [Phytophthora megakarya]
MQRARRRAPKFRPAPLKPRTSLQEANSFCVSCGSRNVVVFPPSNGNLSRNLIKCQSCGVISPDFSLPKTRPGVREDFVPLDKERTHQMADQILDAFTHQRTRQKLQQALTCGNWRLRIREALESTRRRRVDLPREYHQHFIEELFDLTKYLPIAVQVFSYVASLFGFTESIEGVMESVRVIQTHANDDEELVQKLISIRKVLTPTANWIQEDNEADKDDERRRELEQQVLLQKQEEERRKELLALENAKKARLRAKKIALGLDPSVERPPVLVDVPPPLLVAVENTQLELRVNAKCVQKFQWFFNGHVIDTEEFVSGIHRCTLVIPKLTKRVTGEYYCTCENEEGTVSTPNCRVSLAALKLSRIGSKPLGTLASSPMYSCEKNMVMACAGGKIQVCDAKSLVSVKAFPALPAAMSALAWDPQTKMVAAFSAPIQQEKSNKSAQVFFYTPEHPKAGRTGGIIPTAINRQRNKSNMGLPAKPKEPSFGTSIKFQLVDVQSVDEMTEVHAAAFLDNNTTRC